MPYAEKPYAGGAGCCCNFAAPRFGERPNGRVIWSVQQFNQGYDRTHQLLMNRFTYSQESLHLEPYRRTVATDADWNEYQLDENGGYVHKYDRFRNHVWTAAGPFVEIFGKLSYPRLDVDSDRKVYAPIFLAHPSDDRLNAIGVRVLNDDGSHDFDATVLYSDFPWFIENFNHSVFFTSVSVDLNGNMAAVGVYSTGFESWGVVAYFDNAGMLSWLVDHRNAADDDGDGLVDEVNYGGAVDCCFDKDGNLYVSYMAFLQTYEAGKNAPWVRRYSPSGSLDWMISRFVNNTFVDKFLAYNINVSSTGAGNKLGVSTFNGARYFNSNSGDFTQFGGPSKNVQEWQTFYGGDTGGNQIEPLQAPSAYDDRGYAFCGVRLYTSAGGLIRVLAPDGSIDGVISNATSSYVGPKAVAIPPGRHPHFMP